MKLFQELNKDQLQGLANLCFDLAKAEFVLMIVPAFESNIEVAGLIIRATVALISGLAFTAIGVLLLKDKK